MAIHTRTQFETVVDGLNRAYDGLMVFELVGSLSDQPASYHDADIVVHPKLTTGFSGFVRGCKVAGIEIVEIDTKSTRQFPGRPNGQDRVQVKLHSGQVIELFFPKGYCSDPPIR
ncbi:MAG: hypothetical protein ABSA48_05520 [Terracidiphilus sp.]|jgi:hypothetical protein